MRLAEKLSHWNTNSKQALVTAKQKWQPQLCGSLEYNGLLMGLKSQTTDCNQNFNWKFFVPSLTYRLLLSHSLMSHFIRLDLFLSSPALFHHTQTHSHCFVCPSRPGLLKDLKTMGSISLFIFFITLLVLARQVGPNCKSLNDGGSLLLHQHHHCDLLFFHLVSILLHTVLYLLESRKALWGQFVWSLFSHSGQRYIWSAWSRALLARRSTEQRLVISCSRATVKNCCFV